MLPLQSTKKTLNARTQATAHKNDLVYKNHTEHWLLLQIYACDLWLVLWFLLFPSYHRVQLNARFISIYCVTQLIRPRKKVHNARLLIINKPEIYWDSYFEMSVSLPAYSNTWGRSNIHLANIYNILQHHQVNNVIIHQKQIINKRLAQLCIFHWLWTALKPQACRNSAVFRLCIHRAYIQLTKSKPVCSFSWFQFLWP